MIDELEIQQTISLYHEGGQQGRLRPADRDLPARWHLGGPGLRDPAARATPRSVRRWPRVLAPIEYLVQINAPAIIAVDGDTASARSLVRECAKFRDRPGLMDVVGQFNDELQRTPDGWRFARRTFTILGTHTSAGR